MEMNEENLSNLEILIAAMKKDHLGKQDFLDAFQKVVDLVLKIEKRNTDEIDALKQTYATLLEKLRGDHTSSLTDLRKQVDEVFVGRQVEAMVKEHRQRMMTADERIARVRDGKDGQSIKGDKGDRGQDGYIPKKGIDYFSIEEVKTFQEEIKKVIMDELKGQRLRFGGGGGFSKIAMDSHFVDNETPTGTVNGSNAVFTLAHTPVPAASLKVFVNGQKMKLTDDYTVSGKSITLSTAPPTTSLILCDYRI